MKNWLKVMEFCDQSWYFSKCKSEQGDSHGKYKKRSWISAEYICFLQSISFHLEIKFSQTLNCPI